MTALGTPPQTSEAERRCPACGSDLMLWEVCADCKAEGWVEYGDAGRLKACEWCNGSGGAWRCEVDGSVLWTARGPS